MMEKLLQVFVLVILLSCSIPCQAELFSTAVLTIGAIGAALLASFNGLQCKFSECCEANSQWITPDFRGLKGDLATFLHGQHLVQEVVLKAIISHYSDPWPRKALVLSLHGDTGTGKNFVGDIIIKALYKKGSKSKYIKKFITTVDFPHESMASVYKMNILDSIRAHVSQGCERSLFVFDEVHKMPAGVMDGIKAFIDYHDMIDGHDYRKSVFIFLSNTGSKGIMRFMLDWWRAGKKREDIAIADLEPLVQNGSFNEIGGLHLSDIIKHSLVDYYVPFLPLEGRHVEQCVIDDMRFIRKRPVDPEIVRKVAADMVYFPPHKPLFATKGCKNVHQKVGYELVEFD